MAKHELISPAEYARRRGVTRAAVSKAILRCHIPLTNGLLDPLVAATLWQARTDPDQQNRALGQNRGARDQPAAGNITGVFQASDDYSSIRRRRELAEARLAELELQEREGALVGSEEVQKAARRLASAIVQQLAALPDQTAIECGVNDEQRLKLRRFLREKLDRVREEFARAGLLAVQ